MWFKQLSCVLIAGLFSLPGFSQSEATDDNDGWFGFFAEQPPLIVTVDDAYIEMRTGPGRGFPVFHVVEKGEAITLLKKRTDWVKVKTKRGQSGWVYRHQLALTLGPDQLPVTLKPSGRDLYEDHSWELGLAMGQFGGVDSLSFYAGHRFTPNLQMGFSLSQATSRIADSKIGYLRLQHQPWPHWRIAPFFELGAGAIHSTKRSALDQPLDSTDASLLIATGVNIYLSRSFMGRLEYNNHRILTSRDENEEVSEWKVGFNVFF
ncbi:SH3 domain-containing protein [Simiduia agarivorans]|uniref:SH3 domain-containing protein n=1 Tax=Simiduia agarivorans TaxID=447471 RepID=UPI000462B5A1|nr:SH3 domain-containing protein [Simiduia agarivorans]